MGLKPHELAVIIGTAYRYMLPGSLEEADEVLALIAARFFTPYPLLCGDAGLFIEIGGVVVTMLSPPSFFPSSSVIVPSSPRVNMVAKFFDPLLEEEGVFFGVAERGVSVTLVSS
jgi:hypothetical protein